MEDSDRDAKQRRGSIAAGLSVGGALLTGAGGIFASFVAILNAEFIGGGVYLLAAAFAFGLLANAVFRH